MPIVFACLPIAFLIVSVAYSIHAVKNGASRKKAVITQVISFAAVCVISLAIPATASAATANSSAAPTTTASQSTDSQKGLSMMAIAVADGIASIGGGIAVATSAPAAIGATGEDPKNFGKALIFVALGEGIAIYGLLLGILMLQKIA